MFGFVRAGRHLLAQLSPEMVTRTLVNMDSGSVKGPGRRSTID